MVTEKEITELKELYKEKPIDNKKELSVLDKLLIILEVIKNYEMSVSELEFCFDEISINENEIIEKNDSKHFSSLINILKNKKLLTGFLPVIELCENWKFDENK